MKILSIEPTPSPNAMKLTLDEKLPEGTRITYTMENKAAAPDYIQTLLEIPGVASLYHAADFIAIDRHPKGDWQQILASARGVLGESGTASGGQGQALNASTEPAPQGWGEVNVRVQTFRNIPMQVRVSAGTEELRAALPERFSKTAMAAGLASTNLIKERQLEEHGVRYGELPDILQEVVRELEAAYDDERLASLLEQSFAVNDVKASAPRPKSLSLDTLATSLKDADWRKRYAALQQIEPTVQTIPLLALALEDSQMSIRRLATVYLGDLKVPEVLPYLYRALEDDSVAVRRTAGDTLSDLGDPAAIGAMAKALHDRNKLVRWRAARFLYETGDASAIPALQEAQNDPEFEVKMQVKLALERIEGGEAASGSVWQQMTLRSRD